MDLYGLVSSAKEQMYFESGCSLEHYSGRLKTRADQASNLGNT